MFDRIKELAEKRNLNVKELALTLGFSENYFYTVKKGVTMPVDKLQQVANYFNVSTDYLLGRTDVPMWATNEDVLRIDEAIKRNVSMSYDGVELSDDEKEQLDAVIRTVLWKRLKEKKNQ